MKVINSHYLEHLLQWDCIQLNFRTFLFYLVILNSIIPKTASNSIMPKYLIAISMKKNSDAVGSHYKDEIDFFYIIILWYRSTDEKCSFKYKKLILAEEQEQLTKKLTNYQTKFDICTLENDFQIKILVGKL